MLREWRAGGVLYIVVCTAMCTASTVSVGVCGGLVMALASVSHYIRELYILLAHFPSQQQPRFLRAT